MNCKIIGICNQKGGVGKTVSTVNLGIGLAREGKKVLLVDVDSQGSLTASLGYNQPDKLDVTLATLMNKIITDEPVAPGEGILHHSEGIDLLPANIELSGLEVTLVNTMSRKTILCQYLKTVQADYDVILLDCSPSLGMLTINALAAASDLVIPVQPQFLSIKGLEQLLRTIAKVRRQINPGLSISGILITMADLRTNYTRDIIELMSMDELAVMDGGRCILQVQGIRPFFSEKYDITKHPNYKLLSDFDKKNTFDVAKFLSRRLTVKPDDLFECCELEAPDISNNPTA